MNKALWLVFVFLTLFQGLADAKDLSDKELKEKAKELDYLGQLDKATELLGKEAKSSSEKADDGWDMTSMMLGMVWGAIGSGFFIYGKKQSKPLFLLCGIGLIVFPMIVSSNTLNIILGLGLTIAPFKIDI